MHKPEREAQRVSDYMLTTKGQTTVCVRQVPVVEQLHVEGNDEKARSQSLTKRKVTAVASARPAQNVIVSTDQTIQHSTRR